MVAQTLESSLLETSGPSAPVPNGWAPAPPYIYPANLLSEPQRDETADSDGSLAAPGGSDAAWWLIYTKSRQEKKLSEQLAGMRIAHYLPVHKREAVTRGRVRVVEEALFSGYLFLLADDEGRRAALTTNRISTYYRVNDGARLRYELSHIALAIGKGARLTVEAGFEPGDWVRVKSGMHKGLEGVVLRRQNKTKLLLSVNFLKQGASLEVHDSLLELASPPQFAGGAECAFVGGRRFN